MKSKDFFQIFLILAITDELSAGETKDSLFTKRSGFGKSEDYEIFTTVSTGLPLQQLISSIYSRETICRGSPSILGHKALQLRLEIRGY